MAIKKFCFNIAFPFFLVPFIFGCKSHHHEYSPETSEKLITQFSERGSLSDQDYQLILAQLDGMLYEVCNKAQLLVDSGYKRPEIRKLLKRDADYMVIYRQSGTLDSIMVEYLQSPEADPALRTEYHNLQRSYSGKFMKLGLN